ncbi:MAG: hemerythrin domain-containing protein [Candidatus Scalindua sp.]|nr:hemerythrin domain-containing protein [Candidatus Scalindua sp.]MCR4344338.1 hemerythrin domain-containing protein [Candidatus Scalindua sp.]
MSILIEELKKEHSEILTALNEVKELGILSKEGQDKLMSLEVSLLAHLGIEDDQLYPTLKKEAEHNSSIKDTLNLFAMDMENVSKTVLEFFEKYSDGFSGMNTKELSEDFENLLTALTKRIRNEEESLYEEYETLNRSEMS